MNKQILLTAIMVGSLAAMGSSSMAANNNTATYEVIGNVPQLCSVDLPRLLSGTAPLNITSLTGQTVGIAQLTNPNSLATNAASVDVGFAAWCNYAHRLVVESQNNGLWQDQQVLPSAGFANAVPYEAQILWANNSTDFHADAVTRQITDVSIPVNQPAQGDIELRIQVQPGASNADLFSPLIAGTYRDIIRVTVEPQ